MSEKFDAIFKEFLMSCNLEWDGETYLAFSDAARAALVEYVTGLEEKLFFCGHATEPSDAQLSDEASGWSPQYQSVINLRRLCTRHEKEIEVLKAENARLREALAHYVDAKVVTSWGYQKESDDGIIARQALGLPKPPEV